MEQQYYTLGIMIAIVTVTLGVSFVLYNMESQAQQQDVVQKIDTNNTNIEAQTLTLKDYTKPPPSQIKNAYSLSVYTPHAAQHRRVNKNSTTEITREMLVPCPSDKYPHRTCLVTENFV